MNHTQAAIATVCARRGVAEREILSPMRDRSVSWPRQEAQFILKKLTKKSLPAIGREFGRDHTTVIHSLGAVAVRMQNDAYRGEIEDMIREVRQKTGAFTSRREQRAAVFKSTRKLID